MLMSHHARYRKGKALRRLTLLAVGLMLAMARVAIADQDAIARGSDVFDEECAECHSLKSGKNKKGPSLFNVVGRNAGTESSYHYSDALGAGGFVWTAEKIDAYVTHPKVAVPGGKMKYDGLDDPKARANLLEFLSSQH